MANIHTVLQGVRECGLAFIKLNFFSGNIARKPDCYFFPYRGSIVQIDPSAKLVLEGNLRINAGKYKKSKAESYFILDRDSIFTAKHDVRISYGSTIHLNPRARLDAGSFTTNAGINFQVKKHLVIGEDCMFGRNSTVMDSSFHPTGAIGGTLKTSTQEVVIGDHVWVGANAFLTAGADVGDGCIVGANTFISGNVSSGVTVLRSGEDTKIYGNMWARSRHDKDIRKALTYYPSVVDQEFSAPEGKEESRKELAGILQGQFPQIDFKQEDLFQEPGMDSLALLGIVKTLENHFSVKIPFAEITPRNFSSIAAMGRLMATLERGDSSNQIQNGGMLNADKGKLWERAAEIRRFSSLLEAVCEYASQIPHKLFVTNGKEDYTYQAFVEEMKSVAGFLEKIGVKEGDAVIAEGDQSPLFLIVEFALHSLGAVFVPVEQNCPAEKMETIGKRCAAKAVITKKEICLPGIHSVTYRALVKESTASDPVEIHFPKEDDVSEILFSTGTTGEEKGIVLTHRSSVAVAENIYYAVKMQRDNVELIPSPLNHSHGLRSCYANVIGGATIVLMNGVTDMQKFFETVNRYQVNSMDLVPAALSVILQLSGNKLGEYQNRLRYIEFGSAPMLAADREKIVSLLPGIPLYNFYGSTEAGRATVYNFNTPERKDRCIGKPTCNSRVIVVDEQHREKVSSIDNVGFLASGGAMNMREYYHDPDETEKVMKDGYVYSNDEGYFDEDGDIILLGRRGDVINIGGKKVSPEEIESIAKSFPGVADCGCIGVRDEAAGAVPKLFVEMHQPGTLDTEKLVAYITQKTEMYKVPKYIEEIGKIPRTYNGKLLRKELENR